MRRLSCLFISLALFGLLHMPANGQTKKPDAKDPALKGVPNDPSIKVDPKTPPKKIDPKDLPKKEDAKDPKKDVGPSFKHLDGQLLVFVANGVGGSTVVSDNLLDLNGDRHLGLRIQMIPWTRHDSAFKDLTDHEAQLNAAARLAACVIAIRKDAPKASIFFVGHSAGTRVVLAAAEMLPPKSVDRIILLASAVSCTYDLTAALKTSRYGIDNYWSAEDGVLDSAVEHHSTADGLKVQAAGRVGFRLASTDKKEIEAFHKNVRQVRWTEQYVGNGGHYTWTTQHSMKRYLLPLFYTAPVSDEPVIQKKPAAPPK